MSKIVLVALLVALLACFSVATLSVEDQQLELILSQLSDEDFAEVFNMAESTSILGAGVPPLTSQTTSSLARTLSYIGLFLGAVLTGAVACILAVFAVKRFKAYRAGKVAPAALADADISSSLAEEKQGLLAQGPEHPYTSIV